MSEYLSLYTDEELDAEIAAWKAALRDVSMGQSYTIRGRELTLASLSEIKATLTDMAREKGRRLGTQTPRVVQAVIGRSF